MGTTRDRGERGWIQLAVLAAPKASIGEAVGRARGGGRVEEAQPTERWTQLSLRPAGT